MSKKLYIDDDRMRMAIFKSCNSIREMLNLSQQYDNLVQNNKLVGNMNSEELKKFKNDLDQILRKSFYNIDIYQHELAMLLMYLEKYILTKDEIPE